MPIYEYNCNACGGRFEKLVASHRSRPDCPQCGSKDLARLLSTFAAHGGGSATRPCDSGACPTQSGCASGGCPFSS